MKYKVLCLGTLLILSSIVSGCNQHAAGANNRFMQIKEYSDCVILVDKETSIEYIDYTCSRYNNGIAPLLDKDGNVTYYNK